MIDDDDSGDDSDGDNDDDDDDFHNCTNDDFHHFISLVSNSNYQVNNNRTIEIITDPGYNYYREIDR